MRLIPVLFIVSLLSCSNNGASSKRSVNEQQVTKLSPLDSVISEEIKSDNYTDTIEDSIIYIGFVENFYFSQTNEIYTQLFFNRLISSQEEYDSVSNLTEKVIYQDDENARNLISPRTAEDNFDLRGLNRIWLFDSSNTQIGHELKVKNFEFLNQNISPEFIAVYEAPIKAKSASYCIGGVKPNFDNISIKFTSDTFAIEEIENYFKQRDISTTYTLEHSQYSIGDSLILTISNTNDHSFIHKSLRGNTARIYDSTESENISTIQLLPIMINELPILLCRSSEPDTDIVWSGVLIYNGDRYEAAENQRININIR